VAQQVLLSPAMKEAAVTNTFTRRAGYIFSLRHSGWRIGIYDRLS